MKWFFGVLSLVVATGSLYSAHDFRSRYPVVESYEIRPGVLMTPKYAADGDVCEMIIEKRHVRGQTVDFSSSMPRESVLKMIDELAPPAERGKAIIQIAGFDYVTNVSGLVSTSNADYENVAIEIHSAESSSDYGDVAVSLRWKKNKCAPSATLKPLP